MAKEIKDKAALIAAARLANRDFGQEFWDEVAERMKIRAEVEGEGKPESPAVEPLPRRE